MDTDKNLAILATTKYFPMPDLVELRDFRDPVFWVPLLEDLKTISRSDINHCSLGSLERKPTPSLTKDCRRLSLISPTDRDSIGPCNYQVI